MAIVSYPYALDMTPGGVTPVVHVSKYAVDFQIIFTLFARGGTLTIPVGGSAMIRGTKTDGTAYSAACTLSGNTVTVSGDVQMTAAEGDNTFEIVLKTSGGSEVGSANFTLSVELPALDYGTVSDSKLLEIADVSATQAALTQAASNIESAVETFEALADDLTEAIENLVDDTLTLTGKAADAEAVGNALAAEVAPVYSASATYAVGDYVTYSNQLYRCITAITTAEAWTAAHWKAVSAGGEQNAATKKITTVNANLNGGTANLFLEAGSFNFPRTGGINWTGSGKRCITPKETWLYLRKGDVITATNDVLFSCVRVDSDFNRLETVGENTYNATVTIETPGRHILQLHYDGEQVPLTPDVAMRNTTISCNGLNETISDLLIEEGGAYE